MLFCAELLLSAASANIFKLEALCLLLLQTTNPVSSSRAFLLLLFDFLKKSDFITSARFFSPQFFFLFSFVSVWMFESARVPHLNECYLFVLHTQVLVQEKKKACLFTNVIWWAGSLLNSGKLLLMPLENRDNAANLNYRKNVKKKKIFLYWEIINN